MRSHGISQYSFLVYLLGLRNRVTVTFWTSLPLANLSAYYAFVPSFCPSGYDFAIPSSRLHLTMQTLGVAFGLVGNYLPVDFHHRALTCPSYQKNRSCYRQDRFYSMKNAPNINIISKIVCDCQSVNCIKYFCKLCTKLRLATVVVLCYTKDTEREDTPMNK